MKISVFAKGDVLVPFPGQARPGGSGSEPYVSGGPRRYIARTLVDGVYVANKEPFTCEDTSEVGRFIVRQMTRKRVQRTGDAPLVPADEQTARRFGVKLEKPVSKKSEKKE